MAMNAGNADCTAGLSKRIYDYLVADARNGFVSPLDGAARDAVRALCWAVARGVIDEIATNADVVITTSDGGLQRVGGVDTDPPALTKTLSGAIS